MKIVYTFLIVGALSGLAGSTYAQGTGITQYPTALDNSSTLLPAVNNVQSQLSRSVAPTDTTIYISGSASAYPPSGQITIGPQGSSSSEIVYYSGKGSSYFTGCVRGRDGTVAQSHGPGEYVSVRVIAAQINNVNAGVEAIEAKIGTGTGSPTATSILMGTGPGTSAWQAPIASQVDSWLGYTPANKAGDAFTGPVFLAADPTSGLMAATKEYVDSHSGLTSFNTRTGAITLTSGDVLTALGYTPQTPLTFAGMLQDSSGSVSCPDCENRGNKNIANGYAGLTSAGLVPNSLVAQVLAVTDLTSYTGISGTGTTAIGATITGPSIGQSLTWDGSKWINSTVSGGGGGGYATLAYQGTAVTQQTVANFIGSALSVVNNSGASRTDVTLNQSPSGSTSVVGTGRQLINGTGITGGGDLTVDRTLSVVPDSVNEQLQFLNNSATLVSTRHAIQILTRGGSLLDLHRRFGK